MANHKLSVMTPDPIADAHEIIDLCAKTFGNFYGFRKHLRDWYLLNSPYDWNATAIGRMDGQVVTHYGVWDYQMRIGRAVVRCGGIGCVATDGDHRKMGLMAQTVPHSIEAMKRLGYDLTILFGIWDFYHKFGYVRAWSETSFRMDRDHLPTDLPKVAYVELKAEPGGEIETLHNRQNARVTGSAVRPVFTKAFCFFSGKAEAYGWRTGKKLVGHVIIQVHGNRLVCYESTGEPDQVLSVLHAIAMKKGLKELGFETLPLMSPLAKRLRRLTVKMERQYIKSGGAMVRIINLESCLKKMLSELTARMKASEHAGYSGSLVIAGPEAKVGLKISKGVVSIAAKAEGRNVVRGGHDLAQLLIGTDEPGEICEGCGIKLSGDAAKLVPVLFPVQYPQLHQGDRY